MNQKFMKTFTEKQQNWKSYTTALLCSVLFLVFGGLISSIFDIISGTINILSQFLNLISQEEVPEGFTNLMNWGPIAKIALFVAYAVFIWGTTKLKKLLPEDSVYWGKVRTAFILLLVGSFISWALHKLPLINILGYFLCWLLSVIAFWKQKNAFRNLSKTEHYSRGASEGFNHLKNVASSNFDLHTWMPIGTIVLLLIVGRISMPDIESLNNASIDSLIFTSLGGVALVGLICGSIMLMTYIYIFFANIVGWIKVKCGNLVETTDSQETLQTEPLKSNTEEMLSK